MAFEIVSHCSVCAAPIYGEKMLPSQPMHGGRVMAAPLMYGCECRVLLQRRHFLENELTLARVQLEQGLVQRAQKEFVRDFPKPAEAEPGKAS